MRKVNYLLSGLLVIFMSLMIVLLSSNMVLRISATYVYHFNDSEVMLNVPYSIKGNEMAKEITSYFMSFSDKPFQVYEDNRIFKDPIMEKEDQEVMKKAKKILNIELAAGLLSAAVFAGIYIYLFKKDYKKALRNRYRAGIVLSVILIVALGIFFAIKSCRKFLYAELIGVKLSKYSIVGLILGDPFFKTYIMFSTLVAVIFLAVMTYVHYKITKPERIFY